MRHRDEFAGHAFLISNNRKAYPNLSKVRLFLQHRFGLVSLGTCGYNPCHKRLLAAVQQLRDKAKSYRSPSTPFPSNIHHEYHEINHLDFLMHDTRYKS
jgi:hypothetical protein